MILINAQTDRTEKLGSFARYVPLSVPIGIGALSAYLISKGHPVRIWDDAIKPLAADDIRLLLKSEERPYVFGISCLTASIQRGHQLARQIKTMEPGAIVIFGGIHPTVMPDDTLADRNVDFVVRNEGEVALESLYRAIRNGQPYEQINNLSFRQGDAIVHNPSLPGPDMDSLPAFPYHLFDEYQDRYDLGFVIGSRGCPYDCIFCSQRSITGRRFTYRSPEKVVDDIELLTTKYGKTLITFSDDNMLTNRRRVLRMCELIQERGLHRKASFQVQVRGDAVDDEILKALKAANFITLDFGLETASERLMVLINKNETVAQNIHALELGRKYGFELSGTFILGLPTETAEERAMSYRMARKHLDYVRFNNATPYPGTRLYEIALQEGRLNAGKEWENLNACGTLVEKPWKVKNLAYVPAGTTPFELQRDILKYNLLFSFRWRVIANLLDRTKGTSGWFRMPGRWYLDYREWLGLSRLGIHVLVSWAGLAALTLIVPFQRIFSSAPRKA